MKAKLITVAACAAIALGARGNAGDEHGSSTSTPGQGSGSQATERGGTQTGTGSQRDGPGILPDHVEGDRAARPDPSLQPTEAERQAGGAIGRQPGDTKSVVGTVEKLEEGRLTLKVGDEIHELEMDEGTKITSEEQPFSRDELGEGDEVRASFQADSMRATEVHVMSAGAAPGRREQGSIYPESQQRPGSPAPPAERTDPEPSPSESAIPERSR